MIKKIFYTLTLLMFSAQFIAAQSDAEAEKLLTDILTDAKTSAIKTSFKLTVTDKKNPAMPSVKGAFTLKGTKFVLEMDEMRVWFDGKTQWSFVPKNNEVSITEPSEKELAETNPMAILSGFKNKCTIRFSKTKSAQNHCIELIPTNKNKDVSKIEVQINKSNNYLVSILMVNKNGTSSLLTLTSYQTGVKIADTAFAFNPAKHKGIEVNDLR